MSINSTNYSIFKDIQIIKDNPDETYIHIDIAVQMKHRRSILRMTTQKCIMCNLQRQLSYFFK